MKQTKAQLLTQNSQLATQCEALRARVAVLVSENENLRSQVIVPTVQARSPELKATILEAQMIADDTGITQRVKTGWNTCVVLRPTRTREAA